MKKILKEAIMFIAVILVIFVVFCIVFYDDMPTNKIVPETVEYALPSNLQEELDNTLEEEEEVIITYTVTEQDMDEYEDTDSYNPGKINPFAVYTAEATANTDVGGNNNTASNKNSTTTNNKNNDKNSSNNSSNSSTTMFENSSTK